MPKVNDLKAYYREIAAKAGLSEEEMKQVTAALDNEKFAKAFGESFKPLPDYSHDLDDVRSKTRAEKDKEYKDWAAAEMEKFNKNYQATLAHQEKVRQYEAIYGPLTDNPNPNPLNPNPTNPNGTALTKEDIDRLLETRMNEVLQRRDASVLELMDIREQHMNTFKKSLDTKAFEAAWKEHPEWGGSIKQAYKNFMEPDLEKAREAEWAAKLAAAREEGIRDGYTRRALPVDHQSKQFSPLFDRKEDVGKLSDSAQEQHSKEAFMEGLREKPQPA